MLIIIIIIIISFFVSTAILPGEPGLAGFIGAKDDGRSGDNWSYKTCKAPVKSSSSTNQHPTFYKPDALPVGQLTLLKHWSEINDDDDIIIMWKDKLKHRDGAQNHIFAPLRRCGIKHQYARPR